MSVLPERGMPTMKIGAGELVDDLVDSAAIGAIEPTTQGVGEHLLGQAASERVPARPEQGPQLNRAVKSSAARQRPGRIDWLPIV